MILTRWAIIQCIARGDSYKVGDNAIGWLNRCGSNLGNVGLYVCIVQKGITGDSKWLPGESLVEKRIITNQCI